MSTKAVVSPPLKHEGNKGRGEALKKFSLLVEAAPSPLTDYKHINFYVSPKDVEETKAYIKYGIELGAQIKTEESYISLDFIFENLYCSVLVSNTHLEVKEELVPQPTKTVKKVINFPELEAALSPTKPKV